MLQQNFTESLVSLHRAMTGNLTADERKARESLKNAQLKWKMVWKD